MNPDKKRSYRHPGEGRSRIHARILDLFILLFIVSRFLFLDSDHHGARYGIHWSDEGVYLTNAKNLALFGSITVDSKDDWIGALIAPLGSGLAYASFRTFGVSLVSARAPFTVLSVLTLGICLLILRRIRFKKAIYLHVSLLLIASNYVLFYYERSGLAENTTLFLILLCIGAGLHARGILRPFLSGGLVPLIFFSKISSVAMVLSLIVSFVLFQTINKNRKSIEYFLLGLIAATSLITLFYLAPHFPDWYRLNILAQASGKMSVTITDNIVKMFVHFAQLKQITDDSLAYYLLFFLCLIKTSLGIANKKPLGRSELYFYLLLFFSLFFELFLGYAVRRVLFSIPAACLFISTSLYEEKECVYENTLITGFAKFVLVFSLYGLISGLTFFFFKAVIWKAAYLIFSLLLAVFLSLYVHRNRPDPKFNGLSVLLVLSILQSTVNISSQFRHISYTLKESDRRLEELTPKDAVIYGEPWMALSVKRKIKFANCTYANEDAFETEKPAFVLSRSFNSIDARRYHFLVECMEPVRNEYALVEEISFFTPCDCKDDPRYERQKHVLFKLKE